MGYMSTDVKLKSAAVDASFASCCTAETADESASLMSSSFSYSSLYGSSGREYFIPFLTDDDNDDGDFARKKVETDHETGAAATAAAPGQSGMSDIKEGIFAEQRTNKLVSPS